MTGPNADSMVNAVAAALPRLLSLLRFFSIRWLALIIVSGSENNGGPELASKANPNWISVRYRFTVPFNSPLSVTTKDEKLSTD